MDADLSAQLFLPPPPPPPQQAEATPKPGPILSYLRYLVRHYCIGLVDLNTYR